MDLNTLNKYIEEINYRLNQLKQGNTTLTSWEAVKKDIQDKINVEKNNSKKRKTDSIKNRNTFC